MNLMTLPLADLVLERRAIGLERKALRDDVLGETVLSEDTVFGGMVAGSFRAATAHRRGGRGTNAGVLALYDW